VGAEADALPGCGVVPDQGFFLSLFTYALCGVISAATSLFSLLYQRMCRPVFAVPLAWNFQQFR
jgi:hypothetical protein